MYKKALFVCRFQPFHLGHMNGLKFALKNARHVVIGIGSSQEHDTDSNPFAAVERAEIIKKVLKSKRIKRYSMLEIPDSESDDDWYTYIGMKENGIDLVITSNQWVRRVFKEHGVRVVMPHMERRKEISGTIIRRRIRNGNGSWKEFVHPITVRIVEKNMSRIKHT